MTYRYLLGLDDFPPRWHCGTWSDLLGWTHVCSDLATWAAYFAIPVVLFYFGRKRKDIPFSHMLPIFGVFILSCGTGHFIDAVIFWYPIYRVSAVCKVVTALVSWAAVVALVKIAPRLLEYPSPDELQREVGRRIQVQSDLERQSLLLAEANASLEAFVHSVSHDLKQPVRAMKNLAGFVLEDEGDNLQQDSRNHLRKLMERGDNMLELMQKLVTYSRLGRSSETLSRVDVAQIVREAAELVALKDTFKLTIAEDMPVFETTEAPLALVFRNLLTNAVKHHHQGGGELEVGYEENDAFYTFWVKDDGPGISEQNQDRVFDSFRRFSTIQGDGLGLALVEKAVETVGGEVWLQSRPGEGSVFFFSWPRERKKQ